MTCMFDWGLVCQYVHVCTIRLGTPLWYVRLYVAAFNSKQVRSSLESWCVGFCACVLLVLKIPLVLYTKICADARSFEYD